MKTLAPIAVCVVLAAATLALPIPAAAAPEVPQAMRGVQQDDKRGAEVNLDLTFVDQNGKKVALRDYVKDGKPLLLTLNYFRCKMLCTETLNGLADGMRQMKWLPGREFNVATISIDVRESTALAAAKRQSYLDSVDRDRAEWNFLTGTHDAIREIATQVGFNYRYDKVSDQFAHPASIIFISPDGHVSQYLFGKVFRAIDLKFALMDATDGKIGDSFDALAWTCYCYDETLGAYTPFAMGIMRVGAGLTVIILGAFLLFWWRRDRKRRAQTTLLEHTT